MTTQGIEAGTGETRSGSMVRFGHLHHGMRTTWFLTLGGLSP